MYVYIGVVSMHFIAKHMLQVDGVYKSSMCPSGDNNVRLAIVYINYTYSIAASARVLTTGGSVDWTSEDHCATCDNFH